MTDSNLPPELHGLDPGELLARGLNTPRPSGGLHDWTPPTPEELARLLPQYHIERMLGHGGMGAVYQGTQEKLSRPVALKLLPAELTADAEFVTRFEREARTLAQLQHPGIVAIYDFGQTSDGHLYFVMEYVEGTDLRRILQGPGLHPSQALEIIVQVCEALQAAHRRGVVHRDIKPANILITLDGRVKLADFGLARQDHDDIEASDLTCTNDVLGTPDYMAPEQHAGRTERPDHRADIFALGLTLYEMLTGQLPRGAFVPPSRKVQVDVRIDEVVLKALQEEPARRYQQASEMKTDVDHIRSSVHRPATVPPASPVAAPAPVSRPASGTYATPAPAAIPVVAPPRPKSLLWLVTLGPVLLVALVLALFALHRLPAQLPVSPVSAATSHEAAATPVPAAPSPISVRPAPATSATAPNKLEDVLFLYDWQYKTTRAPTATRPSYDFVHGLFFEKDGTVYSRGRNQSWKWSWTATGPRTIRLDQQFKGYVAEITFDPTFTKFQGQSTDGGTFSGYRQKLFTEQELSTIRQNLQERFPADAAPAKPPAEEVENDPPAATALAATPQPNPAPQLSATPQSTAASTAIPAVLPSPTPAPATVHRDARQAIQSGSWLFVNPFETATLTFAGDGSVSDENRRPTTWHWQPRDAQSFFLSRSDARNRDATIMTFDPDFTRFEGNGLSGDGKITGTRTAAATEDFKNSLTSYTWTWHSGKGRFHRSAKIRFRADGVATYSDSDKTISWSIIGPRNILVGDNCPLEFDSTLMTYQGVNQKEHWPITGQRQERLDAPESHVPSVVAAAPAATPAPAASPEPAPSALPQSTIDLLAKNGPAITDQVLAPLDMPSIPEATVTLWREDLLDEASKAPAAAQPAYLQATYLLDTWKSVLRERYQVISTSQFSGAIIDTPDMSTSRKTTLHVWDWLQYSREHDDAARHEVAKQRTADFFASGPPRRWAERTAILRPGIEKVYAGFRRALRQIPAESPNPKQPPAKP
ncbi:hypothetical protein BH09VER1_BH09VER1_46210 [soil metagenome]